MPDHPEQARPVDDLVERSRFERGWSMNDASVADLSAGLTELARSYLPGGPRDVKGLLGTAAHMLASLDDEITRLRSACLKGEGVRLDADSAAHVEVRHGASEVAEKKGPRLLDTHAALSRLVLAVKKSLEPVSVQVSARWSEGVYLSVEVEAQERDKQRVVDALKHGALWGPYDFRFSVSYPTSACAPTDWVMVTAYPDLHRPFEARHGTTPADDTQRMNQDPSALTQVGQHGASGQSEDIRRSCPHSDSMCKHGMDCPYTCATGDYDGTKALASPGHTDLMATPESIGAFMEANPLPSPPFRLPGREEVARIVAAPIVRDENGDREFIDAQPSHDDYARADAILSLFEAHHADH